MFPFSLFSSLPWWAIALLTYASLSSLLFAYPHLLFPLRPKKPEVSFPIHYGAHRGGAGERPENTLSAFDHAIECGCTLLELDVHLTADNQVVVIHDSTTTRTTGQSLVVAQTRYEDLPLSLAHQPAPPPFSPAGTMMHYEVRGGEEEQRHAYASPLLRTVLQRYHNAVVNIDMKDDSDALMDEVAMVVKEEKAEHRVIWGSVIQRMADRLYSHYPHSHLFFSRNDILWLYIYYLTGLLPFMPLRAQYVELPFVSQNMRRLFVNMLSPRIGQWGAERVGSVLGWLGRRKRLFEHLKARGCPVVLWVINDEREMREVEEMGVGMMTDFPSVMQKIFNIPGEKVLPPKEKKKSSPAQFYASSL